MSEAEALDARAKRLAVARAHEVYAWRAVRSGTTITITCEDADGNPVRLTGISSIGARPGQECMTAVFAVGDGPDGRLDAWALCLGRRPQ